MDNPFGVKTESVASAAYKRERQRKSMDLIRLYNPRRTDYRLEYDGNYFVIPNKDRDAGWGLGQRTLPRYLARKFAQEIKDILINEMADAELENIKQKLQERGVTDVIYNANLEFQRTNKFRTDDVELIKKVYNQVWLGIEQEFGVDEIPEETSEVTPQDLRPVEDQVLDSLDRKYTPEPPIDRKIDKDDKLLKGVAK